MDKLWKAYHRALKIEAGNPYNPEYEDKVARAYKSIRGKNTGGNVKKNRSLI